MFMETPKTLLDAINFFQDAENCRQYMIAVRWPDGIVRCPYCDSQKVTYLAKAKVYRCYGDHPKQKFSLKIGTIFEDSPIGLEKWLPATWLLSNCKNGISSYELGRALGITQKCAWHVLHRIRYAMAEMGAKIGENGSPVEMDETYVGGKIKNMHQSKLKKMKTGKVGWQGGRGKAVVMGMLERGGQVRAQVVEKRLKKSIDPVVTANVEDGSHVITDEAAVYEHLTNTYYHEVINHMTGYVREHVHTNGIENFWSLLKRGLHGTYISVEPFHLQAYVAEQVFRFNARKGMNDGDRFKKVLSQIVGKRLTYAELTGHAQ